MKFWIKHKGETTKSTRGAPDFEILADHRASFVGSTEYSVQSTEYNVQSTKYKVQLVGLWNGMDQTAPGR